jgi:signal transduction histidine kinase
VPTKPDPRFLSIAAHDLRGAVGVLDGAMKELAREVSDNPDTLKLTQMMGRSSQRLLLLGDRLSAMSHLLSESDLELQPNVDIFELVKEAGNRAFLAYARRNLRLSLEGGATPGAVHAQTFSAAVAELTALFCSFSQAELKIVVAREVDAVRIKFESDNAGESVHRALRDRQATTQANSGMNFAESVLSQHRGTVELLDSEGSRATVSLLLRRAL